MNVLKSDRVTVVDVDDTLVLWNISEFPVERRITVDFKNGPVDLVPHEKNINTLLKFWKLGYTINVWSASGWEWAETIVKALGLESIVTNVGSKPLYYFDDKPCESWMGPRVYRDPKTGTEG